MGRPPRAAAAASPSVLSVPRSATTWSLAALVESRSLAWTLLLAGVAQTALVYAGWPAWTCPVHQAFGLPCPGCGLSRAATLLLHGDWRSAVVVHPFVLVLPVVFALLALGALAPAAVAARLAHALRAVEIHTRLTFILVTAFLLYGVVRLVLAVLPFVARSLV